MSSENTNQRGIWLSLGGVSVLFRLNTGKGWVSGLGPKGVSRLTDGSVLIRAARSIPLGFGTPSGDAVNGACDLPGWTSVVVTPAMVGHKIAVFTSIECKSDKGKATPDQNNWKEQVTKAGGIAGVVSTPDQARAILDDWHSKFKQSSLLP
jgi:hypothetical protein